MPSHSLLWWGGGGRLCLTSKLQSCVLVIAHPLKVSTRTFPVCRTVCTNERAGRDFVSQSCRVFAPSRGLVTTHQQGITKLCLNNAPKWEVLRTGTRRTKNCTTELEMLFKCKVFCIFSGYWPWPAFQKDKKITQCFLSQQVRWLCLWILRDLHPWSLGLLNIFTQHQGVIVKYLP